MTEIRGLLKDETVEAWKLAADHLDFLVIAPFAIPGAEDASCIAFLPHFGGPHGMLIEGIVGPDYESNPSVWTFAHKWGMFVSAINLELYRTYDKRRFREALTDWSFFGPAWRHPSWLKQGLRTEDGPRTKA